MTLVFYPPRHYLCLYLFSRPRYATTALLSTHASLGSPRFYDVSNEIH